MGSTVNDTLDSMIPTSDYSLVWKSILGQVPSLDTQVTAEYLNFEDTNFFGAFDLGTPGGWDLGKCRDYVRSQGSELYAAALWSKVEFDFLGVKQTRYHLVLVHSVVWFVAAALAVAIWIIAEWVNGQSPADSVQQITNGLKGYFDEISPKGVIKASANAAIYVGLAFGAIVLGYWAISNKIGEAHGMAFTPPPKAPELSLPHYSVSPSSNINLPIPGGGSISQGTTSSTAFTARGGPAGRKTYRSSFIVGPTHFLAAQQWRDRRAYWDGSNYRLRQPGRATGPIAPWNRAVKRDVGDNLHNLAESLLGPSPHRSRAA